MCTDGKESDGYFKGAEAIDFIRYLLRKYKMTGTGSVKSEDDLFMFENTNVNEINLLQTHMDRVRVMLKVRKENSSLEVLEKLEKFIENSFMKSKDLCEEIRKIRQENENLSKITVNFVRGIQERTKNIKSENERMIKNKVYTKDELLAQIGESVDQIRGTALRDYQLLKEENTELKEKLEKRAAQLKSFLQAKQRTTLKLEKGSQFTGADTYNLSEIDDFQNYTNSLQLFIIDGKQQSKEWALFTISSILNEKLMADYQDYAENRKFLTLRKYLPQYFLKHFGCRRLAIGSLKDFIFSLKTYYKKNERMSLFMDLAGYSDLKYCREESIQGNSMRLSEGLMKKEIYMSLDCLKIF